MARTPRSPPLPQQCTPWPPPLSCVSATTSRPSPAPDSSACGAKAGARAAAADTQAARRNASLLLLLLLLQPWLLLQADAPGVPSAPLPSPVVPTLIGTAAGPLHACGNAASPPPHTCAACAIDASSASAAPPVAAAVAAVAATVAAIAGGLRATVMMGEARCSSPCAAQVRLHRSRRRCPLRCRMHGASPLRTLTLASRQVALFSRCNNGKGEDAKLRSKQPRPLSRRKVARTRSTLAKQ